MAICQTKCSSPAVPFNIIELMNKNQMRFYYLFISIFSSNKQEIQHFLFGKTLF